MENKADFKTIDEYISRFSPEVSNILEQLRQVIKEAAPEAKEKISYQMPAFALHGNLVYFAAFKNHIGFYPTASGVEAFKNELSKYEFSKGTIRFPIDKPIPYELIRRIVEFRVSENINKANNLSKKK